MVVLRCDSKVAPPKHSILGNERIHLSVAAREIRLVAAQRPETAMNLKGRTAVQLSIMH
jgi:hypothetical protein